MPNHYKPALSPVLIAGLGIALLGGIAASSYRRDQASLPPPSPTPTHTPAPSATSTPATAKWSRYTNPTLGFGLDLPNSSFITACEYSQTASSYYLTGRQSSPVRAFEEKDDVIIANGTFAKLTGEAKQGDGPSRFSSCANLPTTVSAIKDPANLIPHWLITVKTVRNDAELDALIKTSYGSGCSLGAKTPTSQSGVYDVQIVGDGKDLGSTLCPINYVVVLKYSPSKNKVAQWSRGQSVTFYDGSPYPGDYDSRMEKSLTFL